MSAANPGGWSEWAACRGAVDTMTMPDLHRPSGRSGGRSYNTRQRARIVVAHTLCAGCPVLADCREWALTVPDPAIGMVAGGMTPHQRREAREEQREA